MYRSTFQLSLAVYYRMNTCFIATLLLLTLLFFILHGSSLSTMRSACIGVHECMYSCYYIPKLHRWKQVTLAGTNMRIGESSTPGGVTHTLGRNDRGVTPTGESFIPLTPLPILPFLYISLGGSRTFEKGKKMFTKKKPISIDNYI